jgi:hypothetical protein
MYGYRMSGSEEEQLHLRHLFASAMDHRAPVRVSYFEEKKAVDPDTGRVRKWPGVYVKTTRVVEPFEFGVSKAGKRFVRVVDRTPEGAGTQPEYRTIRLDRIVHSRAKGGPLAVRMLTHGYLCPSLLDNKPLHPTKRVLAA